MLRRPLRHLALLMLAWRAAQGQEPSRWSALHVNEYRTPFTTIRIGGGFLPEAAGYTHDAVAQRQIALIQGGGAVPVDSGTSSPGDLASYRLQSAAVPDGSVLATSF